MGLAVLGMTFLWATSHTGWFLIVGSLTSLLGLLADSYLRDKESAHRKLSSRRRKRATEGTRTARYGQGRGCRDCDDRLSRRGRAGGHHQTSEREPPTSASARCEGVPDRSRQARDVPHPRIPER